MARNCDAFTTQVTQRWVLDNEAGARDGVHMLFHPEGTQAPERLGMPVYTYVMPTIRRESEDISAEGLAQNALRDYREEDPQARLSPLDVPFHSDNGLKVTAYTLVAPALRKYEAFAYIDSPRVVFAVILSANSAEALEANRPLLSRLVDSGRVPERGGECTFDEAR